MRNDKKMQDMSVEDILKSIKGIIDKRNNPNEDEDDVLELTEIDMDHDNESPLDLNNIAEEENLISSKLASETSSILKQFSEKAKSVVKEYKKSKNLTLDELVIDMLRPQLKQWLDDNLPLLVKELVEKELKKLVPSEEK